MQQIIEQLCNGEIYPNEQLKVRIHGYKEAKNVAFDAHEIFESKLSQAMKVELDEFLSKNSEAAGLEATPFFIDGFKMGAKMMLEILEVDKND